MDMRVGMCSGMPEQARQTAIGRIADMQAMMCSDSVAAGVREGSKIVRREIVSAARRGSGCKVD